MGSRSCRYLRSVTLSHASFLLLLSHLLLCGYFHPSHLFCQLSVPVHPVLSPLCSNPGLLSQFSVKLIFKINLLAIFSDISHCFITHSILLPSVSSFSMQLSLLSCLSVLCPALHVLLSHDMSHLFSYSFCSPLCIFLHICKVFIY